MLSLQQELSSTGESRKGEKCTLFCAIAVVVGAAIGTAGFLASERPDAEDLVISFDLGCIREHGMSADCEVTGHDHTLHRDLSKAIATFQAGPMPKLRASHRQSLRHHHSTLMAKSQQKLPEVTGVGAMRTLGGRRGLLAGLLASVSLPSATQAMMPLETGASLPGVLPMPTGSRISKIFESTARVKPRTLPRSQMEKDFAVLMMRRSYSIADDLDFYPMDQFQKEQFLFRQNEWEKYREDLPGVKQGELTDPAYFDFISYVQYATLSSEFRDARQVFEELIDANGTSKVVTRDRALTDDAALPGLHSQRVGDSVLAWINDRFPNLAPVVPREPTVAALRDGMKLILTVFELNGYMLFSELTPTSNGLKVTLVAPATLWSQQMLRRRNDLANDFEVKTLLAYLRKCGLPASVVTTISGNNVEHVFTWPAWLVS